MSACNLLLNKNYRQSIIEIIIIFMILVQVYFLLKMIHEDYSAGLVVKQYFIYSWYVIPETYFQNRGLISSVRNYAGINYFLNIWLIMIFVGLVNIIFMSLLFYRKLLPINSPRRLVTAVFAVSCIGPIWSSLGDPLQLCANYLIIATLIRKFIGYRFISSFFIVLLFVASLLTHEASIFLFFPVYASMFIFFKETKKYIYCILSIQVLLVFVMSIFDKSGSSLAIYYDMKMVKRVIPGISLSLTDIFKRDLIPYYFDSLGILRLGAKFIGSIFVPILILIYIELKSPRKHNLIVIYVSISLFSVPLLLVALDWGRFFFLLLISTFCYLMIDRNIASLNKIKYFDKFISKFIKLFDGFKDYNSSILIFIILLVYPHTWYLGNGVRWWNVLILTSAFIFLNFNYFRKRVDFENKAQ